MTTIANALSPVAVVVVDPATGNAYGSAFTGPAGPAQILFQSALPLIIIPTGSAVSAAGVATLSTTITPAAGPCYGWLPIGYLGTSVPAVAGWYYGVIGSGTSVTFYNNTYSGTGLPAVPASPTAFSGLSGATPTGATGAQTITYAMPANTMGKNGLVEIAYLASYHSSGNNKIVSVAFGALSGPTTTATSTTSLGVNCIVQNAGATNTQVMSLTPSNAYATATQALGRGTVDTTAAVNIVFTINNAAAADFITLEAYSITVYPN